MNDSYLKMLLIGIPCDFMYKIITFKFSKPRLSPFCSCWWNLLAIFHLFSLFSSSTCKHTYAHIHTYMCVYIHTHTFAHIRTCTCMHIYVHTHPCAGIRACTHTCMLTCTCVTCLCAHVHMCGHARYMCTYTHTTENTVSSNMLLSDRTTSFPTPFLSLYHR